MNLQEMALFEQALIQKSIDPVVARQVKKQMAEMRKRRKQDDLPFGKMKFRCPMCNQVHFSTASRIIMLNGKKRRVCRNCGK